MGIDRTLKLVIAGTTGVIVILLGTGWLIQSVQDRAISSGYLSAISIWIAVIGGALALVFLFVIINEFIEVKLQSKGLTNPDK
jgi:hypothetical protein